MAFVRPAVFRGGNHIGGEVCSQRRPSRMTKTLTMKVGAAQLRIADTKETLSEGLAQFVIEKATEATEKRGKFTVAVSGGSLPKVLAADLVKGENIGSARFPSWYVFFADERCVPLDNPDSNYLLAKNELFDKVPIPTEQVRHKGMLPLGKNTPVRPGNPDVELSVPSICCRSFRSIPLWSRKHVQKRTQKR